MNAKEQQEKKKEKKTRPIVFVPTVCKTRDGLRLYATSFTVDAKGVAEQLPNAWKVESGYMQVRYSEFRQKNKLSTNPKSCRTVRLTSDLKSAVQGV